MSKKIEKLELEEELQNKKLNSLADIHNISDISQASQIPSLEVGVDVELEKKLREEKIRKIIKRKRNFKGFTYKDLNSLTKEQSVVYDNRNFGDYVKETIIYGHPVISLFTKISVFEPLFIRISMFFFDLTFTFALNAIFYSDAYITATANGSLDGQEEEVSKLCSNNNDYNHLILIHIHLILIHIHLINIHRLS